jgi:hypothetical protein
MPKSKLAVTLGLAWVVASAACAGKIPLTAEELVTGSAYVPIDPRPVALCAEMKAEDLLNALPNETMRVSISSLDSAASVSFGIGSLGTEGHSYETIVDYIMYTTAYLPVLMSSTQEKDGGKVAQGKSTYQLKTDLSTVSVTSNTRRSKDDQSPGIAVATQSSIQQRIPVYIGVGLRIRATIQIIKGTVQLSNLFSLAAAANAGQVVGSLIIQTLGINGQHISALVPLPTDISQSSVQGAMQSLAAMKAKMYDSDSQVKLQVLGLETPYASTTATEMFIAAIQSLGVHVDVKSKTLYPTEINSKNGECEGWSAKAPSP